MESSRQSMAAEGCSSSESGWTMYIASPMEEDDCSNGNNEGYEDGFHGENRRRVKKRDEEDSDDSMASDASSGPTHNNNNHHPSYGSASSKKDKKDHSIGSKCSSRKDANKQDKKRPDRSK